MSATTKNQISQFRPEAGDGSSALTSRAQSKAERPSPRSRIENTKRRTMDRYVAERGGGSSGTAYNEKDHEVLDQERAASKRVICRATGSDARLIAAALNASAGR